jgi:hypothetical protein
MVDEIMRRQRLRELPVTKSSGSGG